MEWSGIHHESSSETLQKTRLKVLRADMPGKLISIPSCLSYCIITLTDAKKQNDIANGSTSPWGDKSNFIDILSNVVAPKEQRALRGWRHKSQGLSECVQRALQTHKHKQTTHETYIPSGIPYSPDKYRSYEICGGDHARTSQLLLRIDTEL